MTSLNMRAIQTVTVGSGGAANIEFTNIPQTYTDLRIFLSLRNTGSSGSIANISFNSDTTASNYEGIYLEGNGSIVGSFTDQDRMAGYINTTSQTANTFSNNEVIISNYTSSAFKSWTVNGVQETNASTAYMAMFSNLWKSTSAITSITLTPNANTFAQYSTATLYGVTSAAVGAKATGGIIYQDSNYYYHMFTASGSFVPSQNLTADYLVVAGGGSGGNGDTTGIGGGGGGAGGLRSTFGSTGGGGSLESPLSLTANTSYTVTIGAGAAAPTGSAESGASGQGVNGSNSVFSTITATGGGGGGRQNSSGSSGGSGGGGGYSGTSGGSGTTNQGYAGGNTPTGYSAAGGGGAASVGGNSTSTKGGDGGVGVQITSATAGINGYYAGGGGGQGYTALGTTKGLGGLGGGGDGGNQNSGSAGTPNTGGGGGGSGGGYNSGLRGGAGGSGVVIVRYAK